jgi:glycerol-1-phosphate dehydrogenase [NAD(P)+]
MRSVDIPTKIQISKTSEELTHYLKVFFKENEGQSFLFQYSDFGKKYFDSLIKPMLSNVQFKESHSSKGVIEEKFSDWVFSIGGGRTLDISKLTAQKSQSKLVSMPTLIAHDGICSPVAVVDGISQGAIVPTALFVDFTIIKECPIEQIYAGIGDLVANLSAIEDWQLANRVKGEKVDDFAIILSRRAARSIISKLEMNILKEKKEAKEFLTSYSFLHVYIESLVLSGISMSIAGNSRPCSGSEHLISHAIDEIYGSNKKALHGIQVMIATLHMERLIGFDLLLRKDIGKEASALEKILSHYGMPTKFSDIGISYEELSDIIKKAPQTRKGRFTLLDQLKV